MAARVCAERNVNVNCVLPTTLEYAREPRGDAEGGLRRGGCGRTISAQTIVFLASSDAPQAIHGAALPIG
jgi:hypothetical protein